MKKELHLNNKPKENINNCSYFEDVLEKSHRACNNLKLYLTSDDYDGAVSFILTFFDSFFNNNIKVYYKLLKMKFLYYLAINKNSLALDLFKEQIEIFIRESFPYNDFIRIQESLAHLYKLNAEENFKILNEEKEAFKTRIFKPIFIFIGQNCLQNSPDCGFSEKDLFSYLENKNNSFNGEINNGISNFNNNLDYISDLEYDYKKDSFKSDKYNFSGNNSEEFSNNGNVEHKISYSNLINSLNGNNKEKEVFNNKKERKASNADNVFNASLLNNLNNNIINKSNSKNSSFENKNNTNSSKYNCNNLEENLNLISIDSNPKNVSLFNKTNNRNSLYNYNISNPSDINSNNINSSNTYNYSYKNNVNRNDNNIEDQKENFRNRNFSHNKVLNNKFLSDKSSIYNTMDSKNISNFIKKQNKYLSNSQDKEYNSINNINNINNFYNTHNTYKNKKTHYNSNINSTCPSISGVTSCISNTNNSKFSEFTKAFKPKFEKKEAIDKKILRKFRNYLIERFKKRKSNKDFFLQDLFENHNFNNKSNNNNLYSPNSHKFMNSVTENKTDLKQNINDLIDKSFWTMFVQDNFLPPMKYNNPVTSEFVEFKSFSNNFIFWLFSRKGCYTLYENFISTNFEDLYDSFISSNKKLTSDEKDQKVLKNYLLNFHSIYTGESNFYLNSDYYYNTEKTENNKELYTNYLCKFYYNGNYI